LYVSETSTILIWRDKPERLVEKRKELMYIRGRHGVAGGGLGVADIVREWRTPKERVRRQGGRLEEGRAKGIVRAFLISTEGADENTEITGRGRERARERGTTKGERKIKNKEESTNSF
jgi:hypothetical protein